MSEPKNPTGRPDPADNAAQGSSLAALGPQRAKDGSTDSHQQNHSLSELLAANNSARPRATGSDIANILAANTDDAPTVITQNNSRPTQSTTVPVSLPVTGEPPSIAGRRLGHFELIEAIGAGGMAAVLKARDLELGRIVALKILPPEAARDPESVTRFKQEARAAAKLDHENIARVYYCGEDQSLQFIAFEFVEGDNLRALIDRRGQLPAGECVRYMIQVAAGLNHAAERGVVHRDIKPSNILITPDGRAKIVDMGLARYLGSELVNGTVTQSGVTLGTFDYISPEQALDPRRADVRSDMYSLGCTFYHALTGRPPVPEGTAALKLRAQQNDEPLDPRELNPAIPDELAAILARMMLKDQNARYQTPLELIAHLKGLAERLNIGDTLAHDTASQAVLAERRLLPESPRLRPWWVLAVAAVAIAVAAFVVSTSDPGYAPGIPGITDQPKEKIGEQVKIPVVLNATPNAPASAPVRNVEELVKRLADTTTTKVTLAAGTFDLTTLLQGVVFSGTRLELEGAGVGQTTLIVNADRALNASGSLTLKADSIAIRDIWFEIQDGVVATLGEMTPSRFVGLRIEDASDVDLTDCVFMSSEDRQRDSRSVTVARAAEGVVKVTATRCLFAPAAVGMLLPPGTTARLTDCGFAPHIAAVQLESATSETPPRSEVWFDRSSVMLDPGGAAIETGAPANLLVKVSDSLFAPVHAKSAFLTPFTFTNIIRPGVIARVRGESVTGIQLQVPGERKNALYSVDPLGTSKRSWTFDDCKTDRLPIDEKGRVELKQRPWADTDPITTVASESPWKAFRLQIKTEPALFTPDKDRAPVPLGVTFHNKHDPLTSHLAYPDETIWPPFQPKSVAELREKVWYPTAKDNELSPGVFNDLRALLNRARPDDIIYIRHTGVWKMDGEELKAPTKPAESEFKVTFKPFPGSKPILAIQDDNEKDQTLFKMKSGEVTFEGIQFQLKPNRPKDTQIVAAVAVLGGKSCTFKNCTFTLAEVDDSRVAVVHLPDADKVMAMDTVNRQVPKVIFDHCLIRGRGRGVWVEVTRPLHLEATDTLTAIDGPVLLAEAGGKAAANSTSTAKFVRVTALAGGPIIEMRGGKTSDIMRTAGLIKIEVEADECLFVAVPGAGRPLLELDGVEPSDVKSVLTWQVKKANRYANFDSLSAAALIRPGGDGIAKEWNWDDWVGNVGEPASATGKRLGKVTFASPLTGLKDLPTLQPADMNIKMFDFPDLMGTKMTDAGVDPKILPDH